MLRPYKNAPNKKQTPITIKLAPQISIKAELLEPKINRPIQQRVPIKKHTILIKISFSAKLLSAFSDFVRLLYSVSLNIKSTLCANIMNFTNP